MLFKGFFKGNCFSKKFKSSLISLYIFFALKALILCSIGTEK